MSAKDSRRRYLNLFPDLPLSGSAGFQACGDAEEVEDGVKATPPLPGRRGKIQARLCPFLDALSLAHKIQLDPVAGPYEAGLADPSLGGEQLLPALERQLPDRLLQFHESTLPQASTEDRKTEASGHIRRGLWSVGDGDSVAVKT